MHEYRDRWWGGGVVRRTTVDCSQVILRGNGDGRFFTVYFQVVTEPECWTGRTNETTGIHYGRRTPIVGGDDRAEMRSVGPK